MLINVGELDCWFDVLKGSNNQHKSRHVSVSEKSLCLWIILWWWFASMTFTESYANLSYHNWHCGACLTSRDLCFDLQWSMSSETISSNRCQLFGWNRATLIPPPHVFEFETGGISVWLSTLHQCYITEITIFISISLAYIPVHSYKSSLATRPLAHTQLTTCLFSVNPTGVSAKHGLLPVSPWGGDQPRQGTTLETMSCMNTLVHPNYDSFSFHSTVIQSCFWMTLTIYLHFSSSLAC